MLYTMYMQVNRGKFCGFKPVLIGINWAPITKINLHKHLKHKKNYNKNYSIYSTYM